MAAAAEAMAPATAMAAKNQLIMLRFFLCGWVMDDVVMHWWDGVVLTVTCLSFLGLCWQLIDSWWRRPPSGSSVARSPLSDGRWAITFAPLGAAVMYDPQVRCIDCYVEDWGRHRQELDLGLNVLDGNGRVEFVVVVAQPERPELATVEISWVSGTDRRRSRSLVRYRPATGQKLEWRRYRFPRVHSAPGRWVERRTTDADAG